MLDKTFNPQGRGTAHYAQWEASGAFQCRAGAPTPSPSAIVIPPPNVTGRLHIGHALNNTLQDILARFERMRGKDVLWQPGTDHAGIATQLIVERQLAERQMSRIGLGPREIPGRSLEVEGRIRRRHRRAAAPAGRIRRLVARTLHHGRGASPRRHQGVRRALSPGLIYKDKRLVNWDPRLQTAVSRSGSREYRDQGPSLAHQISHRGQPGPFITVATTRPETMLGDTAVAVHPDDERYKALVGRHGGPAADRPADPHHRRRIFRSRRKAPARSRSRPAHDFNDFEVGKRHKLALINILNKDGTLNNDVPAPYRGLVARGGAQEDRGRPGGAAGLLDKIEPITHAVPHDEKTKTVVLEPLSDRAMVSECRSRWRPRRSRRWKRARPNSSRTIGPMSISAG